MLSIFLLVVTKKNIDSKTQPKIDVQQQSSSEFDPFVDLPNHNSRSDCWISYQGNIYDITSYFGAHPGGDALLVKYCGGDATEAYDTKDRRIPKEHSSNAFNLLQNYLIY